MTKLRTDFITHLQLRGFIQSAIDNYIDVVSQLARYIKRIPLELTHEQARAYLIHLQNERKFAVRTLNLHMYSIRSFYDHFLPDAKMMGDIKRMIVPEHIPEILSKQEAFAMIDSEPNLRKRAAIAVLYSSGIRLSECANLKLSDIDRHRMVLRIEQGKGRKDRYALLSGKTLVLLGVCTTPALSEAMDGLPLNKARNWYS